MLIHILADYFGKADYYAYLTKLGRLYSPVYSFKNEPASYSPLRFVKRYKQQKQGNVAYVSILYKRLEHLLIIKYQDYQKRRKAYHKVNSLLFNIDKVELCSIIANRAFLTCKGLSHNACNAYYAEGNKTHDEQYRKPVYSFKQLKIKHTL